jgi:hypothetical protein
MFAKTAVALAALVLGTAFAALAESPMQQTGYAVGWHGKHFITTEKAWFDRASMQSNN